MKQAKKYVRAVLRSNMDVESRAVVRQREAELALRRRAAWIGKEVRSLHDPPTSTPHIYTMPQQLMLTNWRP